MSTVPDSEYGTRPRKSSLNYFRKQNYWTTNIDPEPSPWYLWDAKIPTAAIKSKVEIHRQERPLTHTITLCDPVDVKRDLRDYLLTSTLHGLRYIGDRKLTWFERFFWLLAFGCSLVGAAFFILNVYAKWRSSPMIVSINPENIPLHAVPFPAITICNVNQAKKSVATRYIKTGSSMDKKLLESLCSDVDDSIIFEDDLAESADWDHTRSFLINVTQPCVEMLVLCEWNSKIRSCVDLFNAQLTDEGLCCTFNAVHRDNMFRDPKNVNDMNITFPSPAVDWTPEGGYPPDAPPDGFPWKAQGVGTHHGLTLVVDANIEEYYCASTNSLGFKVLLHNPTETPKIANLGELYGPGLEVRIAIEPEISDAQAALKSIDINKRLCLFSSERELVFFRWTSDYNENVIHCSRTYTLRNCEMECEARYMLKTCKCVLYYMPKNRTTRVCGKADAKCYSTIWVNMTDTNNTEMCDECMPACTELSYKERMSSAPLNKRLVRTLARRLGNRTVEHFIENMLLIHFFFEEGTIRRYTKGEIFGLTEFLSNTGGLLGLCMGFSVMSAVELLYYCTLRALCMARRRRPKPFTQ